MCNFKWNLYTSLGLDPKENGGIGQAIYSYLKGASILRVHDVKQTINALYVIAAILEAK